MTNDEKEMLAFQQLIRQNVARLNAIVDENTSWMPLQSRQSVVENTLHSAYKDRKQFDPRKEHVSQWFYRHVVMAIRSEACLATVRPRIKPSKIRNLRLAPDDSKKSIERLAYEARAHRGLLED